MDLLRDDLKKLYFKFLIPSLGSAMAGVLLSGVFNIVTAGIPSFFNEFANGFIVRAVLTFWNPFARGALRCVYRYE